MAEETTTPLTPAQLIEAQMRQMMFALEDQSLTLAEGRLKLKNDRIRLVRLARLHPDIAKLVGAPTELPTRANKADPEVTEED